MSRASLPPGSCYFYYPRLLCILGTRDNARGTTNFAPVTWAMPLSSEPPLFGVCLSPNTHSHQLVLKTGEFTVSFVAAQHAALANELGSLSGRDTDKARQLKLELADPEALATPMLALAYAAAECRLVARHQVGDQTLLIGEVACVHAQANAFSADGVLNLNRVSPLLYLGHERWATLPTEVPC